MLTTDEEVFVYIKKQRSINWSFVKEILTFYTLIMRQSFPLCGKSADFDYIWILEKAIASAIIELNGNKSRLKFIFDKFPLNFGKVSLKRTKGES